MTECKEKTIQNVFQDFAGATSLKSALVQGIKLFKRQEKLQITLLSSLPIAVKDLLSFEKYLENRFTIPNVCIVIEYDKVPNIKEDTIEKEWANIIEYMAHKYPLTKAILKNSTVTCTENKMEVHLQLKGAEILQLRGFDKILEDTLSNIYSKKYKVTYLDNSEEEYKRICSYRNKR